MGRTRQLSLPGGGPPADRAVLRCGHDPARRMAELREGVWLRPDNLPADRSPEAPAAAARQCLWSPPCPTATRRPIAAGAVGPGRLGRPTPDVLRRRDGRAAAPARGRRHRARWPTGSCSRADGAAPRSSADPLLPDEPAARPAGPAPTCAATYDRYDAAFKAVWRDWFSRERT